MLSIDDPIHIKLKITIKVVLNLQLMAGWWFSTNQKPIIIPYNKIYIILGVRLENSPRSFASPPTTDRHFLTKKINMFIRACIIYTG